MRCTWWTSPITAAASAPCASSCRCNRAANTPSVVGTRARRAASSPSPSATSGSSACGSGAALTGPGTAWNSPLTPRKWPGPAPMKSASKSKISAMPWWRTPGWRRLTPWRRSPSPTIRWRESASSPPPPSSPAAPPCRPACRNWPRASKASPAWGSPR